MHNARDTAVIACSGCGTRLVARSKRDARPASTSVGVFTPTAAIGSGWGLPGQRERERRGAVSEKKQKESPIPSFSRVRSDGDALTPARGDKRARALSALHACRNSRAGLLADRPLLYVCVLLLSTILIRRTGDPCRTRGARSPLTAHRLSVCLSPCSPASLSPCPSLFPVSLSLCVFVRVCVSVRACERAVRGCAARVGGCVWIFLHPPESACHTAAAALAFACGQGQHHAGRAQERRNLQRHPGQLRYLDESVSARRGVHFSRRGQVLENP